jgi:hypothetical protein
LEVEPVSFGLTEMGFFLSYGKTKRRGKDNCLEMAF